jgi:hypothetical protein
MVWIHIGTKRRGDRGEYVGRPSPLGNPFVIGRNGDRAAVIARYRQWLRDCIIAGDPRVSGELERLARLACERGQLTLVCWCAPEACHAEVIRDILLDMLGDTNA